MATIISFIISIICTWIICILCDYQDKAGEEARERQRIWEEERKALREKRQKEIDHWNEVMGPQTGVYL